MQARMDRRHHRDVDIAPARGLDVLRAAQLGLRRAGIAVEEEGAFAEPRQSRFRGFVGLVAVTTEKTASAPVTASAAVDAPSTFAAA